METDCVLHVAQPVTVLHVAHPVTVLHVAHPVTVLHVAHPVTVLHVAHPVTVLHVAHPVTVLHVAHPVTVLHVAHPVTGINYEQTEIDSHTHIFKTRFNIILALSLGNINDQFYSAFPIKICTIHFTDHIADTIINSSIDVFDSSIGSFHRTHYCASLQSILE